MNPTAITGDVIGFGAASLDYYRQKGVVGDDYRPGEKTGWTEADQASLVTGAFERHVGGNVFNDLAFLAQQKRFRRIGFASVLGTCGISQQILDHGSRLGIDSHWVNTVEGYLPSVGIIERAEGDRMVRGRPRGDMPRYMDDELIEAAIAGSGLIVVASLKSPELTQRIFDLTPVGVPLSYNPGSSEFVDHPDQLIRLMEGRRPYLLALNETEIAQLHGVEPPEAEDVEGLQGLVESTIDLAENVLCTAGRGGVGASDGTNFWHSPARLVDDPEDTLGAGDRAHAAALNALAQGRPLRQIPELVVESTLSVIQHVGAHGDLYKNIYAKTR